MGQSYHNSSCGSTRSGGLGGSHARERSHSVGLASLKSRLKPGGNAIATYQQAFRQENILPAKTQIHKVTEFQISRDTHGSSHGLHDGPHE